MNLHIFLLTVIVLALFPHVEIIAQQYASLNLESSGADHKITLRNESLLTEGLVSDNIVSLEEANIGEDVQLFFSIADPIHGDDDYRIALIDPVSSDYFGYHIADGDIAISDVFGTLSLGYTFTIDAVFAIFRCAKYIIYWYNGKVILCRELPDNFFQVNGGVHLDFATDASVDVSMLTSEDCLFVCGDIHEQYLALETFTTWRMHVLDEPIVKFKYIEKYAIEADTNDTILCTITDNSTHSVLYSEALPNKYGINLHDWDISAAVLTTGGYYLFEASGMDKGMVFKVLMRYDGE